MEGVDQIDAFIILARAVGGVLVEIGAVKHHETGFGQKDGALQDGGKRRALPVWPTLDSTTSRAVTRAPGKLWPRSVVR